MPDAIGVDPSIPLKASVPAPVNSLAQLGQFAETGNALLGFQQGQQTLAARQAIGQAYQNAYDPNTHQVDYGKLLTGIETDPRASWMAPTFAQLIQEQQARAYGLNQSALQQTTSRLAPFKAGLAPLIRMGATVSPSDIYGVVAQMHAVGLPTDEAVNAVASSMPQPDPSDNSPQSKQAYGQKLQSWVLNQAGQSWSPEIQSRAFTPNISMVDTGGGKVALDTNPLTNPNATTTVIPNTLTPAQTLQQVTGPVGPKGQSTVIPQGQYAGQSGYGGLVFGGSPTAPTEALPNAAGNPPPGGFGTPSPSIPSAPSLFPNGGRLASSSSAGPMVTALGPGQTSALTSVGQEGGREAAALNAAAQDSPMRQGMLTGMLGDLSRMDTGPNSPAWGNLMGRFVQMGLAPQSTAEGQAARENFEKMSGQFAQQQAARLGTITNDKLSESLASNPNEVFTSLGNTGVLHLLQGNEDALSSKNSAWLQAQKPQSQGGQGVSPDDYASWSSSFNKSFDPRVFWAARMSPTERATLVAGMSPSDRLTFQQNAAHAVDQGWVDPTQLLGNANTPATAAGGQ